MRMKMKICRALTVAGSDSGGGAGIQADLKTFAALGVYGSSVITAITAQNTMGVTRSQGISADMVGDQIDAVLSDIGADAIKTGMLYDGDIIEHLTNKLDFYDVGCLIVDPVMIATSGVRLLNESGVNALRSKLLPRAAFITPNVDEASVLCGYSIESQADLKRAAGDLHHMGADFVVITGITKNDQCIDLGFDGQEYRELTGPLIDTTNTHGTGCSFSAALTAYMAQGLSPWSAVAMAKKYIDIGLRYAYQVGGGRGPINHMAAFFPGDLANINVCQTRAQAFDSWGSKIDLPAGPLLNVIIGGPLCAGKNYAEITRIAVKNGARLIQLREKEGDTGQLVNIAMEMGKVCHEYNALFVVNDRVDIAMASGADGLHIGQDDLAPQMARAILGPEKIIGVSAGNMGEAEAAAAGGADYLGVGPVYPTLSKDCKNVACGNELIAQIVDRLSIPVIAIGGINTANTPPIIKAGASGIAVISAILGANDLSDATQDFMKVLRGSY